MAAAEARKAIVVGAGIAGLGCARALADAGVAVTLIDKGRAAGGRIATRRGEANGQAITWDHGAQYVRARDPGFSAAVAPATAPWTVAGDDARVGVPGMSALARFLSSGLAVRASRTVVGVERDGDAWVVSHHEGDLVRGAAPAGEPERDRVDLVVVAVPGPQAAPLLPPDLAEAARAARYAPSWTVMAAFDRAPDAPDAALLEGSAVHWAARDASKPGRAQGASTWVLQASAEWTRAHLELPAPEATRALLAEWAPARTAGEPLVLHGHRWRFAFIEQGGTTEGFIADPSRGIGACGDSFAGSRLEDCWRGGRALATALLA